MTLLPFLILGAVFVNVGAYTETPVIGIMSLDYHKNSQSFIAASYVKWIESAGGRVVPIPLYKPRTYYKNLLNNLNGVLFPGIDVKLNKPWEWAAYHGESAQFVLEIAEEFNRKGDYFPVWGTCIGFYFLIEQTGNCFESFLCDAKDFPSAIKFGNTNLTDLRTNTKTFKNLETQLYETMQNDNVTIHYHSLCFKVENLLKCAKTNQYRILGVHNARNNVTGVALVESIDKPYYGSFFHPEKPAFEFVYDERHRNIPHDLKAVKTNQYFSNFFVDECRKSSHVLTTKSLLIYNYKVESTSHYDNYEQMYFFNFTRD